MLFIPQKKPLTTKPVFKTSVSSFQIESKCFLYLKKCSLSSPNAFYTSKQAPYDKTRLQNFRFIISNRVQMLFIPQKKLLIESKCFLYLKKSPLPQNPSSKHPFHHFKSSPNVFNTSKKAPYRVQMLFIPQKKPLTTKPVFKTSVSSFQIESKCFLYLKKSPLSSPNAFYTSKKAPYDKTRLQNIRFIISNRVQMLFIPQKKLLIESKCFLYLKKSPLRQNPSSKHPFYHFKSSPNAFYTSKKAPYRVQMLFIAQKKAPYHKTRLQNIRFIISNRVQMLFIPQKKAPYKKTRLENIPFIISNQNQMLYIN